MNNAIRLTSGLSCLLLASSAISAIICATSPSLHRRNNALAAAIVLAMLSIPCLFWSKHLRFARDRSLSVLPESLIEPLLPVSTVSVNQGSSSVSPQPQ